MTVPFAALRAVLLDMDGVLWRGTEPLGDLPALFKRLEALGLEVALVTNNATRSVAAYQEKLARFGVQVPGERILNSAQAAVAALRETLPPGAPVFVVGEAGLVETLEAAGYRVVEDGTAAAVVAALDRGLSYEKLRRATLLLRQGVPFIGTNPDRTYPTPEGLVPGAGAILAALEAASDRQPRIVGKPEPLLFRLALERLDVRPEEALVVGDRLETDIAGGQRAGCYTALVLSGVTTAEQARRWSPPPDLIAPDLTHLVDLLERERHHPGRRVVREDLA